MLHITQESSSNLGDYRICWSTHRQRTNGKVLGIRLDFASAMYLRWNAVSGIQKVYRKRMRVVSHRVLFIYFACYEVRIPYILESNPQFQFHRAKNHMRIRFAVDSWILEK